MIRKIIISISLIFVLCIAAVFSAPTEVVEPYGTYFSLNGQPYAFVGVNLRGIAHYGEGDILPYTTEAHSDENLDAIAAMGGKVIRLFAACKFATHQENVNRLQDVLNDMESRGLKAIVCFTDVYHSGFHPQGDDTYYMSQPSGWTLLDDTWFKGGYENNYKPYVELAVTQLKDHNAVFAWELGNELTDIKDPDAIIPFTTTMAAAIKAIDPWHMVTTGFIGIDHTQIGETQGYDLYNDPNIDFMTQHSYDGSDQPQNHAVHSRLQIPLVLEEFGWTHDKGDRVANTTAQMDRWLDDRAAWGFLQWGYQYQDHDIGDGDMIFGMDRNFHSDDYNELYTLYSNWATQLANAPALPDRLSPDGSNVAIFSTEWQTDSSYSSSYEGDKAYDGVVSGSNKWTSDGSSPPHWLILDLGQQREINGITLRMSGDANELIDFNFKSYRLESASSMSGPWTTEFEVDNSPQFSWVHSLYDTPATFRYLRVYITDTGIDNYARLPEIEVYEEKAGIETWALY